MSKAAFIGLGAMGARMATNLLKAGHEVTVCDLAPEAVDLPRVEPYDHIALTLVVLAGQHFALTI